MAQSVTIQHGDTLSAIAQRAGISLSDLLAWNPVFTQDPKYKGGNEIWAGGTVYLEADNPRTNPNYGQDTTPPPVTTPIPPPPDNGGDNGNGGGTTTPPPPPATTPDFNTLLGQLTGDQRNAYSALETMFDSYGLSSLAPKILDFVQQGFGSDTITLLLQDTPEYKQRFAANDARLKAGLPVLSPAQYLSAEQSYRQIASNAGLPAGFYDNVNDFTQLIAKDISPTEYKTRVDAAQQATTYADPATKQALADMGVGQDGMVAYFLDPTRATSLIQQQINAAQIGGAALRNNLNFNQDEAMKLANLGVSQSQAIQGYGTIASFLPQAMKLGTIYGQQYNQGTAEAEVFENSGAAAFQRQTLASQERAQFGGANGGARQGLQQAHIQY